MIKYQLLCAEKHTFESWFSNSAAFEKLQEIGEVACPTCGSTEVRKAIMAPNVSPATRRKSDRPALTGRTATHGTAAAPVPDTADAAVDVGSAPAGLPEAAQRELAQLVEAVREIRRTFVAQADNVGHRFAEEARKIHYEEVEPRAIYGQASPEEAEALADEGVGFFALPTLPEDRN